MSRSELVYGIAGTESGVAFASGHFGGRILIHPLCASVRPVEISGSIYDQGLGRLAFAPGDACLAAASFCDGIEGWNWRSATRLWWRPDIGEIQAVFPDTLSDSLCVETDGGSLYFLNSRTGVTIRRVEDVHTVAVSAFAPLLFATGQETYSLMTVNSAQPVWSHRAPGTLVLGACFTRQALVVLESGPVLRVLDIVDGRVLAAREGGDWSAFVKARGIPGTDSVVAWSSLRQPEGLGELVRLDLLDGQIAPLIRRPWMHATPVDDGRAWVFENGELIRVAPDGDAKSTR